jgi:phenylacetate-CoA ligase
MDGRRKGPGAVEDSLKAGARERAYLLLHRLTGSRLPVHYRTFLAQDRARDLVDTGTLLGRTLEHAVATVPHYRGAASSEEIRRGPFAALASFPVLTREVAREQGPQLLSTVGDRSDWVRNTSGGSTGEPVELFQDPEHVALSVAIREVYSTWAGGRLGSPELYIWGSERDLEEGRQSPRARFANRLLQRRLLNAFMLTEEAILSIVRSIQDDPPRFVIAYAQAGYEVARFIDQRGLDLPAQRGLISTAGTLSAFMRSQMEESFGCDVFDRYGSRETGDMAGECEHHRGLHVLPWSCHVEVLDESERPVGPGEEGDIVVTGFTNMAMPLIRYRIGDRARLPAEESVCPCGRETQMLDALIGRTVDVFLRPDGGMIDGEYFTHLLYFRPWLRQFQVVQTAPERVVYRLAADGEVPPGDRDEIVTKTRNVLGGGCEVEIEEVDSIQPSPSGKLRYTIRDF